MTRLLSSTFLPYFFHNHPCISNNWRQLEVSMKHNLYSNKRGESVWNKECVRLEYFPYVYGTKARHYPEPALSISHSQSYVRVYFNYIFPSFLVIQVVSSQWLSFCMHLSFFILASCPTYCYLLEVIAPKLLGLRIFLNMFTNPCIIGI